MIGVIGLGFVGLTTALGFAYKGNRVYGYDINAQRLDELRRHEIPFHEPGLREHLVKYAGKRFFLAGSLQMLVRRSKIIFFCVGTPADAKGAADLSFLKAAIKDVLAGVGQQRGKVLVIKSTVPPGTIQDVIFPFVRRQGFEPGRDVGIAGNPEFLREGAAWEDFIYPDRVVIGTEDARSARVLTKLYAPFGTRVHCVSPASAEFIKYLSNTLLATMISFSNEMAMIAETAGGVDLKEAFAILHEDRRWRGAPMASYVYPGCGFGGYCLPKDTQAMRAFARKVKCPAPLLEAVICTNERIKDHVVDKIVRRASRRDTVGVLGLAFKPGSDDVRDAPALSVIRRLLARGYSKIVVHDPLAMEAFRAAYGLPVMYADSVADVVRRAKVTVLLTAWPQFKAKFGFLRGKDFIDGRYFIDRKART